MWSAINWHAIEDFPVPTGPSTAMVRWRAFTARWAVGPGLKFSHLLLASWTLTRIGLRLLDHHHLHASRPREIQDGTDLALLRTLPPPPRTPQPFEFQEPVGVLEPGGGIGGRLLVRDLPLALRPFAALRLPPPPRLPPRERRLARPGGAALRQRVLRQIAHAPAPSRPPQAIASRISDPR